MPTWLEYITALIALGSLFLSWRNHCVTKELTKQSNTYSRRQTELEELTFEINLRDRIESARREVNAVAERVKATIGDTGKPDPIIEHEWRAAAEAYRTAYEDVCKLYLDGKIDEKRFKAQYRDDIRRLIIDPYQSKYYDPATTRHPCTRRVYNEGL